MAILPYIYLGYMFISVYFLSFYFLLYLRNRKTLFDVPELKKHFSVSVIVPAYNEEATIAETIRHIFQSDYDNLLEVIVTDDCSKDNTGKILDELKKKYKKLKVIHNKHNTGSAAGAQNIALKKARGEIIAVVDADSYPAPDAIKKLVGFFEDPKVGAATCPILARNNKTFFERLQSIEYSVIALTRKLLEGVDAIYVTPGPLALYRQTALSEIGGFDEKNLTQDIEATWHITVNGWKRKMCLDTKVTSTVPSRFKPWFKQRQRWNMGGMQTINKYKSYFFKKGGMVSYFILPFFILSTFLGLVGLSIFIYLIISRFINQYLLIKFSIITDTAVVSLSQFYFTPSILNYLGIVLFVMGTLFTLGVLYLMKQDIFRKRSFPKILFYLIIYLAIYPIIMITAIFKLLRKDMSW